MKLLPMNKEEFEQYQVETIYVDGGLPRDGYGYLGDPLFNEDQWNTSTKDRSKYDLARRTQVVVNMSHYYAKYIS